MRLQYYLAEEIDHDLINWNEKKYYDNIANQIKKDSKEWLRQTGGLPGFRASRKRIDNPITRINTRKDRRPLTTNKETHNLMDDLFLKHHGWRARSNVLFTQGGSDTHPFYGYEKYAVFPIGKFNYLWSPKIADLGPEVEAIKIRAKTKSLESATPIKPFVEESLTKRIKEYKNKGLRKALVMHPKNEIMVNTKEYYLIPYHIYITEIKERLSQLK